MNRDVADVAFFRTADLDAWRREYLQSALCVDYCFRPKPAAYSLL